MSALLDAPDSAEPSAIEDQLLGRIVSAAYTRPPGERHPAYGIDVADRTLSFFAEHMSRDGTTDLAWWHLHRWAPTSRRLLARSLPVGLVIVISGFLPEKYATAVITIALLVGVLAMGGLGYRLRGRGPQRMDRVRWRAIVSWRTFGVGLTFGFLFWFMALSIYEVFDSREVVYEPLAIGLASGLIFAFVAGIAQPGTGVTTSVTPVSTWRADQRVALLFGLAFGLALATVFTVVGLLTLGYTEASGALPWYVFIPLAVGLVALLGLLAATLGWLWSIAMTTRLAFAQFAISHHLPIRLMNFLEDARDRDVLRTVGPVYQFRHARLQDHLALKQGIAFGRPPTIQGSVRPERDKLAGPALRNSILGLIIPFVLLVYAWVQANDSLRAIRASGGRLTGERIARLARTISIIGLVIQGLLIGLGNVIARAA